MLDELLVLHASVAMWHNLQLLAKEVATVHTSHEHGSCKPFNAHGNVARAFPGVLPIDHWLGLLRNLKQNKGNVEVWAEIIPDQALNSQNGRRGK
jgi:hypothetical protein